MQHVIMGNVHINHRSKQPNCILLYKSQFKIVKMCIRVTILQFSI